MRRTIRTGFATTVGALLLWLLATCGLNSSPASPGKPIALQELGRRLVTASMDERRSLLRQFEWDRQEAALELSRLIVAAEKKAKYAEADTDWHTAVLLLGYLGDGGSCDLLLDRIAVQVPRSAFVRERVPSGWFPAMEALQRIGAPAIPAILQRLGRVDGKDDLTRLLHCEALRSIFGKEYGKDLAIAAVQVAIRRASNEQRRAELRLALAVIEKFKD